MRESKDDYLFSMHYQDPHITWKLTNQIQQAIPHPNCEIIILCIGTDRSTGDSFGPLTGSFIHQRQHDQFTIYGTLDHPVHAKNLEETLNTIYATFEKPFIIAIDAALGSIESQHSIIVEHGSMLPGAATEQAIPAVGDLSIKGIVNVGGFMPLQVLQSTRLSIVMALAKTTAQALSLLNYRLRHIRDTQTKPVQSNS